jgi:DNA-binding NarL/FixJ family response regulator
LHKSGARGYILKDGRMDHFLEHIRNLKAGGSPISPMIARQLLKHLSQPVRSDSADDEGAALSERETEVLNLLARGFSYDEIAGILELSPQTIATYVKRLYRKLGVHSRSEAVFEGTSRGMIDAYR